MVSACPDDTLVTAPDIRRYSKDTGKDIYMKDIKWTIRYDRPPAPLRYCKKCNTRQEFVSSGQFRVNAQGKYLDIWLIDKCSCCSATWNAAIYSRITPGSLPPGLLSRFHENDPSLVLKYSMDTVFLRQNGASIRLPLYHAEGEVFGLDGPAAVTLWIDNPYPLPIRVHTILKDRLHLSQRSLDLLADSGRIRCDDGRELKKSRTESHIKLIITGVSVP